jgi:hypothetical protein
MITSLISYIEQQLSAQPVLKRLEEMIASRSSKAGTRREEVFTREFLCPTVAHFFYAHIRSTLNLQDREIASGLGTEGFQNAQVFGFTPAHKRRHLFTKADIVNSELPPSWRSCEGKTRRNQACPDFAIRPPLPFSLVAEVKFFTKGSPQRAVKELYDAARQAVFYLGAYQGEYANALLVVADASSEQAFVQVKKMMNPDILDRFGEETRIYLSVIPLH